MLHQKPTHGLFTANPAGPARGGCLLSVGVGDHHTASRATAVHGGCSGPCSSSAADLDDAIMESAEAIVFGEADDSADGGTGAAGRVGSSTHKHRLSNHPHHTGAAAAVAPADGSGARPRPRSYCCHDSSVADATVGAQLCSALCQHQPSAAGAAPVASAATVAAGALKLVPHLQLPGCSHDGVVSTSLAAVTAVCPRVAPGLLQQLGSQAAGPYHSGAVPAVGGIMAAASGDRALGIMPLVAIGLPGPYAMDGCGSIAGSITSSIASAVAQQGFGSGAIAAAAAAVAAISNALPDTPAAAAPAPAAAVERSVGAPPAASAVPAAAAGKGTARSNEFSLVGSFHLQPSMRDAGRASRAQHQGAPAGAAVLSSGAVQLSATGLGSMTSGGAAGGPPHSLTGSNTPPGSDALHVAQLASDILSCVDLPELPDDDAMADMASRQASAAALAAAPTAAPASPFDDGASAAAAAAAGALADAAFPAHGAAAFGYGAADGEACSDPGLELSPLEYLPAVREALLPSGMPDVDAYLRQLHGGSSEDDGAGVSSLSFSFPDAPLGHLSAVAAARPAAPGAPAAAPNDKCLFLSRRSLSVGACLAIASLLRTTPGIRLVSLSGCNIGDEGAMALCHGLLGFCPDLAVLDLRDCGLGDVGLQAIATCLSSTTQLLELHLANNYAIGDIGLLGLAIGVRSCPSLRKVTTHGTSASQLSVKELQSALVSMRRTGTRRSARMAAAAAAAAAVAACGAPHRRTSEHLVRAPPAAPMLRSIGSALAMSSAAGMADAGALAEATQAVEASMPAGVASPLHHLSADTGFAQLCALLQLLAVPSCAAELAVSEAVSDLMTEAEAVGEDADLPYLADGLSARGFCVALNTATGGGAGSECLRNLRHSFLSVTCPLMMLSTFSAASGSTRVLRLPLAGEACGPEAFDGRSGSLVQHGYGYSDACGSCNSLIMSTELYTQSALAGLDVSGAVSGISRGQASQRVPPYPGIIIVDPSMREQFDVACPTDRYEALVATLPRVFVGAEERLPLAIELLCEELASAFRAKGLMLPPWREAAAMITKWQPRPSSSKKLVLLSGGGATGSAAPQHFGATDGVLGLMPMAAAPGSGITGVRGVVVGGGGSSGPATPRSSSANVGSPKADAGAGVGATGAAPIPVPQWGAGQLGGSMGVSFRAHSRSVQLGAGAIGSVKNGSSAAGRGSTAAAGQGAMGSLEPVARSVGFTRRAVSVSGLPAAAEPAPFAGAAAAPVGAAPSSGSTMQAPLLMPIMQQQQRLHLGSGFGAAASGIASAMVGHPAGAVPAAAATPVAPPLPHKTRRAFGMLALR